MGQRLNISMEKDGKVLANAYYHWSAYTMSALDLTRIIVTCHKLYKRGTDDPFILAVVLLECTGAGVNLAEHIRIENNEELRKKTRFRTSIDRNCGLISVTEQGIKETENWEEGRVSIDLENELIFFNVFYEYTLDEFKAEFADLLEPGEHYANMKEYDFDFGEPISFEEFGKLEKAIEDNPVGFYYEDYVYLWIE